MNEREEALEFLARLGAQPAVAYHEAGVASVLRSIVDETDGLTGNRNSWRSR